MKNKNQTDKKGKSFMHLLQFVFLAFFIAVVSVTCFKQMNLYYSLKGEEQKLTASIENERQKQIELSSRKEYYNSDAYIEKVAREQLGLVKPNEILFINRAK